jgi:hypothetical protein
MVSAESARVLDGHDSNPASGCAKQPTDILGVRRDDRISPGQRTHYDGCVDDIVLPGPAQEGTDTLGRRLIDRFDDARWKETSDGGTVTSPGLSQDDRGDGDPSVALDSKLPDRPELPTVLFRGDERACVERQARGHLRSAAASSVSVIVPCSVSNFARAASIAWRLRCALAASDNQAETFPPARLRAARWTSPARPDSSEIANFLARSGVRRRRARAALVRATVEYYHRSYSRARRAESRGAHPGS